MKDERSALTESRKNNLFHKNTNLVRLLHDKGNGFVVVGKETDQDKAQEQIDRSSFKTLDHDPTSIHIKLVSEWLNRMVQKS